MLNAANGRRRTSGQLAPWSPAVYQSEALSAEGPEPIELPSPASERLASPPPKYDAYGRPILYHEGQPYGWRPFSHPRPADPDRHTGWGEPLVGTSWLNRPWEVGWFLGGMFGDELRSGHEQSEGAFGGYRVGYDFDHYFGTEFRFGWAVLEIVDDAPQYTESQNWLADLNLMYYPWGDTRWRPYASLGLGLAEFDFIDSDGRPVDELLVGLPVGVGVKYLCVNWAAVRMELHNNIVVGNGSVNWMDNISLTAGMELRFGGRSTSYFPW